MSVKDLIDTALATARVEDQLTEEEAAQVYEFVEAVAQVRRSMWYADALGRKEEAAIRLWDASHE
jgi:hypothetical protein